MVPGQTGLTVNIDTSHATGYPALCTNGDFNTLTGHDDWLNIVMPFQQFAESATGPVNPSDGPEPTDEQILAQRQLLNTTDLAIAATGPAGPYEAGVQLTLPYSVQVTNQGPNSALPARMRDTLPPGTVLLSHDSRCPRRRRYSGHRITSSYR